MQISGTKTTGTIEQIQKEILDAELEIYTQRPDADISALRKKVSDLRVSFILLYPRSCLLLFYITTFYFRHKF